MELKLVLILAIFVFCFARIAKGFGDSNDETDNCKDKLPTCQYFNHGKKPCDNKEFAVIACRKTCNLCNEPRCIIPTEHPKNGTLTVSWDKTTRYFQLNYKCNEGYFLMQSTTRTCTNTTWSGSDPKCTPDCRKENFDHDTKHIQNITYPDGHTHYKSTAVVKCESGYVISGSADQHEYNISCDSDGTWKNLTNCERIDCGDVRKIGIDHATERRQNNGTKYTSTAEIDCDEGYYIIGEDQLLGISTRIITCNEKGKWTNISVCIPKDCGPLEEINMTFADLRLLFTDTKYKSQAAITCNSGYYDKNKKIQPEGISTSLITCSQNGTWSNLPNCSKKDCGNVSGISIDHATERRQNNGTKYTSTAEIDCDKGYYIQNEDQQLGISTRNITCNDKGKWTKIPVCIPKVCGEINISNAAAISYIDGTIYTSVANVSCDRGFKIDVGNSTIQEITSRLIRCNEKGIWDVLPKCVRKDCGAINGLNLSNTENSESPNNDTKYNATAEVKCLEGYYDKNKTQTTGISKTTVLCSEKGHWVNLPSCVPKECGNLANLTIENAKNKTSINGTEYTSVAIVTCDVGFKVKDEQTKNISTKQIVCNSSGHWSNLPSCIRKDCGTPNSFGNGSFDISNGTKFEDSAFYRCNPGYTLHGDNSTKCLASGEWSEISVNCTLNKCVKTPNITNITHGSSNVTESNATYQCDKGYTLNGNKTLFCLINGTWNTKPPTCQLTDCGRLNNPNNGNVTFTNTTYNSTATFECNDGFSLTDNTTSVCTASGNWSNTPTCKIKDCGNITNLSNVQVDQGNGTTYLSVLKYSCDVGYTLNGSNTTKCIANGTWDNTNVRCEKNDCGQPDKPTHGHVSTPNGTNYKSVSQYTCSVGYDLNGAETRECQANESWSLSVPTCEIKNCSELNDPANGKVSHDSGHVSYNDNATYSCNAGYRMHGSGFVTCTANGTWSSNTPECKDIDECAEYTNNCSLYASCKNSNGSYTCKCYEGFTDNSYGKGRKCEDIDECSNDNLNNCNKNGSSCDNFLGGYICFCNQGWTGKSCSEDIDECTGEGMGCGVNANCSNSIGSYKCSCIEGYPQGDPKIQCYEKVVIDFLTPAAIHRGDNQLIDAETIRYRFPYFGTNYNSFRANMNGFLTFGYQPLYENYGPENPNDWKTYSEGHTVIAPFWTDLDSTNLTGGVQVHLFEYYKNDPDQQVIKNDTLHRDLDNLTAIFTNYYNITNFKPRVAFAVTWRNVTQHSYIRPTRLFKTQNATMQAILISDGIYSYLMFNYDHQLWSLKVDDKIPSSAGYSLHDMTGFILADSKNFTTLNNASNVGLNGRWIYNVSGSDTNQSQILRNESECIEFRHNKTIKDWIRQQLVKAYACPCTQQQMDLDYSYDIVDEKYGNSQLATCYEAWVFNSDGVKQTCCYDKYGALKKDGVGGGFATFENDCFNTSQYFYKCCSGDRHLCHLYYEMNPSDDCSRFDPADEPFARKRRAVITHINSGARQQVPMYWAVAVILMLVQSSLKLSF